MTPDDQELLKKIESFDIDGGDAALPFAARLAREHGWSRNYADRVVREYKRYVFLAMSSDTPVCPSEDVDAAWHLHLTYTRSYWKRFCGETLGRPLHHDPTRGGATEADKHLKMYEATLAAYREAFGEEPPADIWPPSNQRFGIDTRQRTVNTARNWVIPKRPVKRVLQVAAAFLIAAVLLPGCNGGLDPFALEGAKFLLVLVPAMIFAMVLGRFVRKALRRSGSAANASDTELTWEEAAYLAGGYPRLTTAAIARLAEAKIVKIDDDQLEAGKVAPGERSPVENVIIGRLPIAKSQLRAVQDAIEARFGIQAARLEEEGFIVSKQQQIRVNLGSLLPLVTVVLFLALPRLLLGWQANKPVEYLVLTTLVLGFFGFFICLHGSKNRSLKADYALDRLRSRNRTRRTDAGLAVALFGTSILAGTTVAYLQGWYPHRTATSADGGCGSGCSTSTSSDSGGGGDGGGGCGGCGGGGGGGGGD